MRPLPFASHAGETALKRIICLAISAVAMVLGDLAVNPAVAQSLPQIAASSGYHDLGPPGLHRGGQELGRPGPPDARRRRSHHPLGGHHSGRGARWRPLPQDGYGRRHRHGRPDCELGLHGCEGRDGTHHGYY